MPAEKLYLETPAVEGRATVTEVVGDERPIVRLDRTLFHPQGGGQLADRGELFPPDGPPVKVLDVRHSEGGEVDHFVDRVDGLTQGLEVRAHVDQERRSRNARLHSAGHLVAEVAEAIEPTIRAKAGHHWPGEARVEFDGVVPDTGAFEAAPLCSRRSIKRSPTTFQISVTKSPGVAFERLQVGGGDRRPLRRNSCRQSRRNWQDRHPATATKGRCVPHRVRHRIARAAAAAKRIAP